MNAITTTVPQADLLTTEPAPAPTPEQRPAELEDGPTFDENDWSAGAPGIVIHHQPRTKVYANVNDQIVIRQERDWCETDDPFVYFSRENVPALIAALQHQLAKI